MGEYSVRNIYVNIGYLPEQFQQYARDYIDYKKTCRKLLKEKYAGNREMFFNSSEYEQIAKKVKDFAYSFYGREFTRDSYDGYYLPPLAFKFRDDNIYMCEQFSLQMNYKYHVPKTLLALFEEYEIIRERIVCGEKEKCLMLETRIGHIMDRIGRGYEWLKRIADKPSIDEIRSEFGKYRIDSIVEFDVGALLSEEELLNKMKELKKHN